MVVELLTVFHFLSMILDIFELYPKSFLAENVFTKSGNCGLVEWSSIMTLDFGERGFSQFNFIN